MTSDPMIHIGKNSLTQTRVSGGVSTGSARTIPAAASRIVRSTAIAWVWPGPDRRVPRIITAQPSWRSTPPLRRGCGLAAATPRSRILPLRHRELAARSAVGGSSWRTAQSAA